MINPSNFFKFALVFSLFTIAIGLILNGMTSATASNERSELLPVVSITEVPPAQNSGVPLTITTYDDVLAKMHPGQWFGWSDPDNKVYDNLEIYDQKYTKPTKVYLDAEVAAHQAAKEIRKAERDILESTRGNLENRFMAGTYSDSDVIEYLRLLGGF